MGDRVSRLEIHPGRLEVLERLDVDAIALIRPPGEREPQGLLGLVDWRLGGRIARMGRAGWLEGAPLLTAGGPGFGPRRIFVFSEGDRGSAARVLLGAGAGSVALAPRADRDSGEDALAWLAAASGFERVVMLDPDGGLERLRDRIAKEGARFGLDLAR